MLVLALFRDAFEHRIKCHNGSIMKVDLLNFSYLLTLSMPGKIFSRRHFEIFFLFFPENRLRHLMPIVFFGDNLHEMSKPIFWGKIRKISSLCLLLN